MNIAKKIQRGCHTQALGTKRYALIWDNGFRIIGEPWKLARLYLKTKNILFSLKKIDNHLFYFIKFREDGAWMRCRPIADSGDYRLNLRAALTDYFHNGMKLRQDEFRIFRLKPRNSGIR